MSILSNIIAEVDKRQKESNSKSQLYDLEKTIREMAKSKGLMPRNFLIKIAEQNPKIANNRIIQHLIGEQDVPTQKGRDAKPEVLTKRAMNVVKKSIKHSANKQRRRMDKDAVSEGSLDQFRNLYKKSIGSDDAAVALRELINAINDDALWSDQFPQLKKFVAVSPLSGSKVVTAKKIPGNSYNEKLKALVTAIDDDQWVNDTAKHLMRSYSMDEGEQTFEDEAQDRGYAQMIIQQHPQEYKKFMQTGDLIDAPTIYEKLFQYFHFDTGEMPYGTAKARDGDPYVWLVDKLDELGLIIEEGNEFAQKVRQMKAAGAKKGTKFKTSDGEEHTLEGDLNAWYAEQYARELAEKDGKVWDRMSYGDKEDYRKIANKKYGVVKSEAVSDKTIDSFHNELDRLVHKYFGHSPDEKQEKQKMKEDELPQPEKIKGSVSVQQIVNLFPEVDDKTQFMQAVMKLKQGQPVSALPQVRSLAQAFKQMIGMNPQETQKAMNLFKRIQTEEQDQGEVRVGSYQTKHFDICPSATKLYKDIDVEDMDLAERSAKLHDTLFYMEKHAMEMKKADPEYIEMMQNLADQIMAMAGMMGLESEHEYVQSHVDAVKNMKESVTKSVAITEEEFDEQAGKKDACYHKVKARYKVWPSAYASGALVQCRKKGAANWGNNSK